MDIHRCRFVPYPPQSINALAFSHSSDTALKAPSSLRLALGRSSGDIELWNPQNGDWFQETVLRGGKDRSIEGLVWTQDLEEEDGDFDSLKAQDGQLRLFSIGATPTVTEWDLASGAPARNASSNFGDIWCLAAQQRPSPAQKETAKDGSASPSQLLAAGCGDGMLVLFSTEDNDLVFVRSLGKPTVKKPRKVLSITWRDRNTIIAGYDDSTIRIWDIRTRNNIRSMTLGKPAEGNESYVWCVKCLPDGTILSGDSSGELKIWDANNYSLVQRIKAHEADILDIGTSATGDMITTVGVDRRTVAYKPLANSKGAQMQRWTQSMHRRFHQHEIKAIATFESEEMSIMVSGGVDTVPVVAPMRHWEHEYHRSLSNLPQKPQLSSAGEARLVLSWWGRELLVWRIGDRLHAQQNADLVSLDDRDYELISRMVMKDEANITSAHISGAGTFISVATATSVKLFQLRMSSKGGNGTVRTRSIELPTSIGKFGARLVGFSPDGRWLCVVRLSNVMVLAKIPVIRSVEEKPIVGAKVMKLTRKPRKNATQPEKSDLGSYTQTITNLVFSADSRILATGDTSGSVDTWMLEGHESDEGVVSNKQNADDTFDTSSNSDSEEDDDDDDTLLNGQRWIRNPSGPNLPQLASAILALTFRTAPLSFASHEGNGDIGLHPTRHNPKPVSHEMPQGDVRLIAVTANHKIVEFDVLGSRLSDWTRRNPASCLPRDFSIVKDRVMDCFWDDDKGQERLWLYGPSWLFMLDMSQDLPASAPIGRLGNYDVLEPLPNAQKKRKLAATDEKPRNKRNTGAGDKVHDHESYIGVGRHVQKFKEEENVGRQVVEMVGPMSPISTGEVDAALYDSTLALMRRKADDDGSKQLTDGPTRASEKGRSKQPGKSRPWWLSFEYRSIFGLVPIGGRRTCQKVGEERTTDYEGNLEVVVIERPIYDLDFPPRFDGGQDWET